MAYHHDQNEHLESLVKVYLTCENNSEVDWKAYFISNVKLGQRRKLKAYKINTYEIDDRGDLKFDIEVVNYANVKQEQEQPLQEFKYQHYPNT